MLSTAHQEQLAASAITDAIRDTRPYRTITDVAELVRRGFVKSVPVPGLYGPGCSVNGNGSGDVYRPDAPRITGYKADGSPKIAKYEFPKGSRNALSCHPSCREHLDDPKVDLWFLESIKKLDAGLSAGSPLFRCGVALSGVYNWRGTNAKGGRTALADFEAIALNGRKIYVCLDNDPKPTTKAKVDQAINRFAAFLKQRGADVWIIEIPLAANGSKGALDDYLAAGGTIEQLVPTARLFEAKRALAPITGLPFDADVILAARFANLHKDKLRHVAQIGEWFIYDEARGLWAPDNMLHAWTLAKELTRVAADEYIAREKTKNPSADRTHVKSILSKNTVANIIALARSEPALAALDESFDTDPMMLNTPAGAVNLKSGQMRPARPDDFFSKTTTVAPVDMPTPVFDLFLTEIMGAEITLSRCTCAACCSSEGKPEVQRKELHLAEVYALAEYLMRCGGYSLTADVREEKLFVWIGPGGNGKGVLAGILQYILGTCPFGYSTNIVIEALLENKGGPAHPTELMGLRHARLAFARESDEATVWNEGRVKQLTGQDPVTARPMRQDFVTFPATHKLCIFGNVKPGLRGGEQSAWKRRLHMLEFQQKFDDEPDEAKGVRRADKTLKEKLQAEAPGILHKLIQACLEWQRIGLAEPKTVRQSSDTYLASESAILSWLNERVDQTNSLQVTTANELWADFSRWCAGRKADTGKRTTFNDKLLNCGIRIERTNAARGICKGVRLKPIESGEPEWSNEYGTRN